MRASRKKPTGSELETVPSIGPAMARDLIGMGITTIAALGKQDPEALYERLCRETGVVHDPCVRYTFRCAVYYASRERHDPALLKWWNWKDRTLPRPAKRNR